MSKEKLTAAEWELVRNSPFWVNRALTAADGRVAFFAKRREAKALEKALKEYKAGNALINDIISDEGDPTEEIEKASQEDAEQALSRVAVIVKNKLGDDDLAALRSFLLAAGRAVAESSREGGTGMSKKVSAKEEEALKNIEKSLKVPTSTHTQGQPSPKPAQPQTYVSAPAAVLAGGGIEALDTDSQAQKEAEAKARLEKARKEAEERQREAATEREAKAAAEAAKAREEAARREAEAKAAAEKAAASAPKYTQFIAEHTVVAGDNLSFISQKYYGTQANFRIIYEANKDTIGDNMNLIRPGQVLKIPKL